MGDATYHNYFQSRGVVDDNNKYVLPKYIYQVLPGNKSAYVLDIGCGHGCMLDAFKKQGYTNLLGIDISPDAVVVCLSKHLNVMQVDDLEKFCEEYNGERFSFVIMHHVLEHIVKHKIIRLLQLIREKLLLSNGDLFIAVPNAQSNTGAYWAYEDFTHHLLFTSGSLKFALIKAGFQHVEFLDPNGMMHLPLFLRIPKKILLTLYSLNVSFWNLVTTSSFHRPSPRIFTYDIKVIAK